MGEAYFYHLTRRAVDETLIQLLARARAAGWRVVVRGRDAARMATLDEQLWLGPEETFLAHGLAGGDHDALQPILLTTGTDAGNAPHCVMTVDGADVGAAEVASLDRVCILFDGADDAAVETARSQWRALTAAGAKAQYWSEASGRWEKKAQT